MREEDDVVAAEEAGVQAAVENLVQIGVTKPIEYPNGDRSQYLDLVFRLRWLSGDPAPVDGENTDARWFSPDALPALSADMRNRLQAALDNPDRARFATE